MAKQHYVDNKKFFGEMLKYKKARQDAENTDDPCPRIPDYIGECFVKIAEHLSYKPNFINYTFREDMVSDGVENCLQYISNFDPEKSQNPFAYFTQIIYYAFLRRIQKEKKQLYIKYKSLERAGIIDDLVALQEGDNRGQPKVPENIYQNLYDFVEAFEEKNFAKKESSK